MSEKPAIPGRPKLIQQQQAAAAKKPDEVQETPEQKQYRRRRQVAQEVLQTENSYCTSLAALVDVAVPILKEILTEDETKLLFSSITTILQFNQNFCSNLDQCLKGWSDESILGQTFLTFTPYLKMYTQYVSNHESATNFERELSQQGRFLKVQNLIFQNPRMLGSSSLANFLIMPIQRIPRYSLLLTELIKTTPDNHEDLPHLQKALAQVNEVAHKVNAEITAQQNRQLVYEKTQMLGLDEARFIQPSRHFVKQGPMTKVCRSKDTTYEFFLFNDVLIYASKVAVVGLGKFKVHQEIPIDSSFGIQDSKDDEKRSNQFKIINSIKSFAVYAETPQIKAEWMKILTELIHKAKSKIQTAEDAGPIVPVWIPDDNANECLCCSTQFTFFNRKHHCRFCGGVVCGGCSKRKAFLGQGKKEERICDQCVDLRTKYSQMQSAEGAFGGRETVIEPEISTISPTSPSSTNTATTGAVAAASGPTSNNGSGTATTTGLGGKKREAPTFISNPEPFKPSPLRYHALQTNTVVDVGDLGFQQGDTIMVYYRSPDGWWTGTNLTGDQHGIFQSSLVTSTDNIPDQINEPINASLIIQEQPEQSPANAPKFLISYQSGQIVIVMFQLDDWSLVYNLSSGSVGWLPSTAIVALNSGDDDSASQSFSQPNIPSPSVPSTPSIPSIPSIPVPEQPKMPSMPLPASPPITTGGGPPAPGPTSPTSVTSSEKKNLPPPPNHPASPRALPPPSSPPPSLNTNNQTTTPAKNLASPRVLPPPSGPPPNALNNSSGSSIPPVVSPASPTAGSGPPAIPAPTPTPTPASPTAGSGPPAIPAPTPTPTPASPTSQPPAVTGPPAVPAPAAAASPRGPPPARTGPPPQAAPQAGASNAPPAPAAAAAQPKGGCGQCKCEAFRCTPIKKAVCVDCGHASGDHKA